MATEEPGTPVETALVGRDLEARRIEQLVASVALGPRFVAIRGEAGIGKTSIWRWALERHRRAGHRVLLARASEEEFQGPIVGLIDLFEHVAIDDQLLLPDLDRFDRGHRVLSALRTLAAVTPVVVAIDDVQWLDPVTAAALRYALRRLEDEPVVVLATERTAQGTSPDARTIPADRCEEILLGPLRIEATREVVSSVVASLSRPALERIHELSGGNPMYAIELARAVDLFDDPLVASVPPTLRDALSARIGAVAPDVLAVLQVAAALGPSSIDSIAAATAPIDAARVAGDAIRQRLLIVGPDGIVRFEHPLVAAAVLAAMNPVDRQALHGRLADIVTDADARARHLVHSCAEPDADVAAELESAAGRAARRGASAVAADLAAHSVRVTPATDAESQLRRRFLAIRHRAAAGETARALAETDSLVASLPPGRQRAEAISMRVSIDFAGAGRYLDQALREAGDDDLLRGRILEMRAWMATIHRSEPSEGVDVGGQALAIASRIGDRTLEMLASCTVATASLMLGQPRPELLDRALRLDELRTDSRLGHTPQIVSGRICLWCGQLAEARAIFEELHDAYARGGLEYQRPYRLFDLALVELASGKLATAAEVADDGIEAASDAGNDQAAAWVAYPAALAAAHLGRSALAERWAGVLRSHGLQHDGHTRTVMAHHVVGVVALAAGEPTRAVAELEQGFARFREAGVLLPAIVPIVAEAIEALALSGDAARCAESAAELERRASAVQQPWVTAAATRSSGLAAFAAGRPDAAPRLADAAAMLDELGYRLDAARTLLLRGRALRRAGHRNASADTLTDALERFTEMSAAPWMVQAEVELARVANIREAAALTPTESRVSALVAAGRRNREIAGELNMSVATVEAHLTRIYRKLHVRSRTELARVVR